MASTTSVQATPIALSRYLTENVQSKSNNHFLKSNMYLVASAISAIAAVAILGGLSAIYLGLLPEILLSGWEMVGVLALFVISMMGVDTFSSWRRIEKHDGEMHQLYANTLKGMKDWTERDVKNFFASHGIDRNRYTQAEKTLLMAEKPAAPLTALLPLIARYKTTSLVAASLLKSAADQQKAIKQLRGNEPLIQMHQKVYKSQIEGAAFYNLSAAFYLQCLKEPTLAASTDHTIKEAIVQHGIAQPSWASQPWNLLWYGSRTPKLDAPLLSEQSPREIRRLLFA